MNLYLLSWFANVPMIEFLFISLFFDAFIAYFLMLCRVKMEIFERVVWDGMIEFGKVLKTYVVQIRYGINGCKGLWHYFQPNAGNDGSRKGK